MYPWLSSKQQFNCREEQLAGAWMMQHGTWSLWNDKKGSGHQREEWSSAPRSQEDFTEKANWCLLQKGRLETEDKRGAMMEAGKQQKAGSSTEFLFSR